MREREREGESAREREIERQRQRQSLRNFSPANRPQIREQATQTIKANQHDCSANGASSSTLCMRIKPQIWKHNFCVIWNYINKEEPYCKHCQTHEPSLLKKSTNTLNQC